jgi:hypothetical protein
MSFFVRASLLACASMMIHMCACVEDVGPVARSREHPPDRVVKSVCNANMANVGWSCCGFYGHPFMPQTGRTLLLLCHFYEHLTGLARPENNALSTVLFTF